MDWLFNDLPDVAVITTQKIMKKQVPILYASHDKDDGMWQFHSGSEVSEMDGRVISLEEIINIDSSVMELYDLPEGWIAIRDFINSPWIRKHIF